MTQAALQHETDAEVVDLEQRRVQAALAGDGRAFAALVRPHLPMLYRVAARSGGAEFAEDAVQETLTIAHSRLADYTPGTSLKSWLASIAAQRAWTNLRGEMRRRQRNELAVVHDSPATPEQELAATRLQKRVHEALGRLPEKRRKAAMLRLDAGLSYAEIATAVGSTERSARVLVHMALKTLREELGDLLGARSREGGK